MTSSEDNPFAGFADVVEQLQAFSRQVGEAFEGMRRNFELVAGALESFAKTVALVGPAVGELLRQSELIDKAGFIPHPTMPQEVIQQSSGDPTRLSELLEQYYEREWPSVRDSMMASVNAYQIDNEAKEAFREALTAHEKHFYRSVVRNLFPEIERVARNELYKIPVGRIPQIQCGFERLADKLPAGDWDPSWFFGLTQLNRLRDHLYIRVDEANHKQIEADAVPNRHAAVHGIVVYRTAKNSLNTIFMTDFIYQIINVVKVRYADQLKAGR